mmetsp:Transcript_21272/g.65653  ORF Transcript_21272/g.65653 Transcript_21272/m.65653 type:complete len:171 (+) Transcript_21272:164-676(+)
MTYRLDPSSGSPKGHRQGTQNRRRIPCDSHALGLQRSLLSVIFRTVAVSGSRHPANRILRRCCRDPLAVQSRSGGSTIDAAHRLCRMIREVPTLRTEEARHFCLVEITKRSMHITLQVIDTFVLPQWFETATREEISDALCVAPLIFHHVASLRSQDEFTALREAHRLPE